MDDLEKLVNEIFKEKRYWRSYELGSVIITFIAPLSEVDSLIKLAMEQSSFITKVGLFEIVVGDTMVIQNELTGFSFKASLLQTVWEDDMNMLSFLLNINTYQPWFFQLEWADSVDVSRFFLQQSQKGHTNVVALLLNANVNPNGQRDNSATPPYKRHSLTLEYQCQSKSSMWQW